MKTIISKIKSTIDFFTISDSCKMNRGYHTAESMLAEAYRCELLRHNRPKF